MSFFERYYPKFVSALGGVGLGTALAYFVGAGVAFQSTEGEWAQFFLIWGPPLVVIPGVLLIAHLYLRTHLGGWLVDRGRYGDAIAYTERRLEAGLMRSQKEVHYHRIYLARARIGRLEYRDAAATLTEGYSVPESGREAAAIRRWQMEVALRVEDSEIVESAYEAGLDAAPPQPIRAALNAGRAEWAVLEGSREAYHTHMQRARWADREHWRFRLSRAFGAVRFGSDDETLERGLRNLDAAREEADREVPGRGVELDSVRADLLERLGRREAARDLLESVDPSAGDERAERRYRHVASRLRET